VTAESGGDTGARAAGAGSRACRVGNAESKARGERFMMMMAFGKRMLTEVDFRLLSKFAVNFGIKGIRSVEIYKKRLARGEYFPPFLFISVISSCQLRCQGCWVDVEGPSQRISLEDMNRLLNDAKAH